MTIEVVVYNIESALKAQEGGADRIELCDNPSEGGTTPSFATIESVRQNVSMD
jgi:copper homeostasis protein